MEDGRVADGDRRDAAADGDGIVRRAPAIADCATATAHGSVDAAHGASAVLGVPAKARRRLARAILSDPHKMMRMPLDQRRSAREEWLREVFQSDAVFFHHDRAGLDLGAMTIQYGARA
jgi:hypothetical protein